MEQPPAPKDQPPLHYHTGEDEGARRRLDHLDGCFMFGLGLPIVALIGFGMVAVIWNKGSASQVPEWVRWLATAVIIVGVTLSAIFVFRTRRKQ